MEKNFTLTSREFAESIDITLECLYSRIRRGHYKDQYISENKLLWFKRMRPSINDQNINDNSSVAPRRLNPYSRSISRPKMSLKRERRRGVHAAGKETKYPNYAFEKHNEIKMLVRLKGKLSEEVINEIVPETIKLAQEKIYQEKQKRLQQCMAPIKYYGKGIYNAKTAQPNYRAFGKPIRRDDDSRNWVHDLPGKPKTYY
jgi:hypothetical protein